MGRSQKVERGELEMKVRIASDKKEVVAENVDTVKIETKEKIEEVPTVNNTVKVETPKNWHDAAKALAEEFTKNDKIV
jgi:uncharacterized protein YbcV (DUF1398 family)